MRTGVNGFQPNRLTQARDYLGMTQAALSTLIGVSPATISNWEKGIQAPEYEKLETLSSSLNFPINWFLKKIDYQEEKPYFYRSLASNTKAAREMTRVKLDWVNEIADTLSNWLDWPKVNIPTINETNFLKLTDEEIESIAIDCRNHWKLGLRPIDDVILSMESAGIICSHGEIGYLKMDGISKWYSSRPFAFIATDKANGIRNRFDAAHELGHILLHRNVDNQSFKENHKEVERQADLFAGSFLLPADSFSLDVSWPTLDNFLVLKQKWKVSIAAMIMRCYQLGIIDDDQKLRLFKARSARGWIKGEPYDNSIKPEQPKLLNRAIKMLIENNILSRPALVDSLVHSPYIIENICNLDNGYLSSVNPTATLIELKSMLSKNKPHTTDQKENTRSNVIEFKKR